MTDSGQPVGEALEGCLRDSKKAWLKANQVGRPAEVAWTQDTVTTYLDAQFSHNKLVNVQITVVCSIPWKSKVYRYTFERSRRGLLRRIPESVNVNVS